MDAPGALRDDFDSHGLQIAFGQPRIYSWARLEIELTWRSIRAKFARTQNFETMLKFCRSLFFCLFTLAILGSANAQVVISEFLADNATGLSDEDRDKSDWIELFNAGPDAVNLNGWYLTDDALAPTRWRIPATNLNANAYLLIIASGKNRTNAGRQLHTSFSLSSGGEHLALVKPDGKTIEFEYAPEYPQQNPNVSYGLVAGSLTDKRFFSAPTPGLQNSAGLSDLSDEPVFSIEGGIYTNTVTLTLSSPQPNAVIRYTLNGADPISSSAVYSNALTVVNSTVVRAKAFVPGLVQSTTVTKTYHILSPELFEFSSNLPILVLSTFGSAPNESTPVKTSAMLIGTNHGRAEIRAPLEFNGRGTLKIRGSSSTQFPKKSYAFELQDELLQDKKASLLDLPKESDWILYAPYTDKSLVRDFLAYEICNLIGTYAPRTRLIEVFVDVGGGKVTQSDYQGVYVLIEKIKRDDNRVDIASLLPSQITQPEVTGGYIWKMDRLDPGDVGFGTSRIARNPNPFGWVEPKEQEIVAAQKTYLSNYLKSFETALYAANFTNKAYTNFYNVKAGIDHHLMVEMTKNIDGYRLSTFIHKDRLGKITMGPIWDYNLTLGNADYLDGWNTSGWYYPNVGDDSYPWYRRLFQDPDFNQQYIDRWFEIRQKYIASTNLAARVDELAFVLREAAARNYVKWPILGQYVWPNAPNVTDRKTYKSEMDWMRNWMVGRFAWMDSQFLKPPAFTPSEGNVTAGATVTFNTFGRTVYYTTNGTDPRAPGGLISPSAKIYSNAIPISVNTRIIARARASQTSWSAPTDAAYVVKMPTIAVTEIMYNPGGDADSDFEYLELKNTGTAPIHLYGFRFTEGIDFICTNLITLNPSQLGVLIKDPTAFQARFGSSPNVLGAYTGALDNSGERITLKGPSGERIFDFTYNNSWYPVTDGLGFSLVVRDGVSDLSDRDSWRSSGISGGTPGADDPGFTAPKVVITEVLTHTDAPSTDAIELFNAGETEADIGNWFLTDDRANPFKFKIPADTKIQPGAYRVFNETDFNRDPLLETSFALNSLGDEAYLYSADASGNLTGYSDGFHFDAAENDKSFGRLVTSDGKVNYPVQSATTLDAANAAPAVGPLVINEIRFAPGSLEAEFVEIKNITDQEVKLYDPLRPTNRWRISGLNFTFPPNSKLPPNSVAVIAPGDLIAFRTTNSVPHSVPYFGPFSGNLQDNGELLQILKPDAPTTNNAGQLETPWIIVDEVRYNDVAPWPIAKGATVSLERIQPSSYGNDPANWRAVTSSPGDPAVAWSSWGAQNFTPSELSDTGISGPAADADGDGASNQQEYVAGTDPRSPASVLQLTTKRAPIRVGVQGVANRSYTVYFRASLASGAWAVRSNYFNLPAPRLLELTNPPAGFYKVIAQ